MFLTVVASINVQTTAFKAACRDLLVEGLNIFNQLIAFAVRKCVRVLFVSIAWQFPELV